MIRLIVWISAALLSGVGLGRALADSDDVRTAIEARYAEMKVAMAARDPNAIRAILAPNFVSIDTSNKSETADEMIAELNSTPTDPTKISKTTLLAVQMNDAGANVEQRYDMNTHKTDKDGAQHTITLEAISTDLWILAHGQWCIQRTITNKLTYYIDGKLAAHRERASGNAKP